MKPTTMAEIENRKKNDEPSNPNCSGSSFNSVMIGTPARPTTILSAKFTSMKRNSRNVILQAPLGVGCVVMSVPSWSFCWVCWIGLNLMLPAADQAMQRDILTGHLFSRHRPTRLWTKAAPDHDRVAVTFEAVISCYGLVMLRDNHRGSSR